MKKKEYCKALCVKAQIQKVYSAKNSSKATGNFLSSKQRIFGMYFAKHFA